MIALLVLRLALVAHADEGMWLPEQLPARAGPLRQLGLELDPSALSDPLGQPLGSIVTLGFCSASFISPDGLIATNHHCVTGYLQYLSDAGQDRNKDGYLARSRKDELWVGPGSELQVVERITDVKAQVLKGLKKGTKDAERERIVSRNRSRIESSCEEGRPHLRCQVASYYGGAEYRLIEKRRLRDVRLVYAPPESVGSYGGEIDNWMWPRHGGDFALLRAYVAPDGSAAEHAGENIPYRSPHFLEINPEGVDPGDFVMVAGYPGSTYRYRRAEEMRFAQQESYPFEIELTTRLIAILQEHAARDPEAKARLTAHIGYLENDRKYAGGMLENFDRTDVLARKAASEKALVQWIEADRTRQRRYGPVLAELDAIAKEDQRLHRSEVITGWLTAIDLLGAAYTAVRWAGERAKPDDERDDGYQDRDRERIVRRLERLQKTMWIPSDRDALGHLLEAARALPEEQQPKPVLALIDSWGGIEASLEKLHKAPALAETPARLALLEQDRASLEKSADPWVQLALALEAWNAPLRQRDKERKGAMLRLQPLYVQALREQAGGELYPDANGTLRITVGQVKGYKPADGLLALPRTTVQGVVEKAGDWPFDAPEQLLRAVPSAPSSRWADPDLDTVPVNFLSTLDTTGGNSGSATLDAKGRLVGLVFDGNYESMSADWVFDPKLTRSIHVDIRYLLWVLEEVEGAHHLLAELGFGPRSLEEAPVRMP